MREAKVPKERVFLLVRALSQRLNYTRIGYNRSSNMMTQRLPEWLKIRIPRPETIREVEGMMRKAKLHTVCESARCPNLPECWSKKSATFMILGDTCTRSCGFCAIKVGRGLAVDPNEPQNVAEVCTQLGLKHVVVTSVARDDLKDEGATQFALTIQALHNKNPELIVEVLTPDFKAKADLIRIVTEAGPEIYNHNVETVRRLQTIVRPQAGYDRSLNVLRLVKEFKLCATCVRREWMPSRSGNICDPRWATCPSIPLCTRRFSKSIERRARIWGSRLLRAGRSFEVRTTPSNSAKR